MSLLTFVVRDYSDEYSAVTFPLPDIANDGSNWGSVVDDGVTDNYGGLQTALAALTKGNIAHGTFTAFKRFHNDSRPASKFAQRELGLRLYYQDTVNFKKYHLTIPAPDMDIIDVNGDDVDLTNSIVAAVVTWMQTNMESIDGNPVDIYKGRIVGRRS